MTSEISNSHRTADPVPAPVVTAGPGADKPQRVVLFLQGHPSWFWGELADALSARGWRVLKVNFCLADRVFWGLRRAKAYRGAFRNWEAWLEAYCRAEGVTDILYFADRLPYHVVAQTVGARLGIWCQALEFGYLRPDWLTLEEGGMGTYSRFPKKRAEIEALAEGVPEPDMVARYRHIFTTEACFEVTFNLLLAFGRPFYPRYFSDRTYWPAVEYLSWLPVLADEKRRLRQAKELEARLKADKTPFNLLAMQLETDYQIRDCSPYDNLQEFLEEVLDSFLREAPADRHLVVKIHPLDNGLHRWFSRIAAMAERRGIGARVHVIRGGDLAFLLRTSKGVIVVNSTVGMHGLLHKVPVCTLGDAVYDVPGLTHQAGLDSFWTKPERVDFAWLGTFRRALSRIQVKGSFFQPEGRQVAIAEICRRLEAGERLG